MARMEFLRLLLVFLHFIGFAALLAGFLGQMTAAEKRIVPAMIHGGLTQLVTGLALVGVDEALDKDVNNAKVGVKLAVLVVILLLAWANRAKPAVGKGVFFAVGGLTVLNVAIAVFWV